MTLGIFSLCIAFCLSATGYAPTSVKRNFAVLSESTKGGFVGTASETSTRKTLRSTQII